MKLNVTINRETREVEFGELFAGTMKSVEAVALVKVGRGQKVYPVYLYAQPNGSVNTRQAYALGRQNPILGWNDAAFAVYKTVRNGYADR